jgi:hypothetical protein
MPRDVAPAWALVAIGRLTLLIAGTREPVSFDNAPYGSTHTLEAR